MRTGETRVFMTLTPGDMCYDWIDATVQVRAGYSSSPNASERAELGRASVRANQVSSSHNDARARLNARKSRTFSGKLNMRYRHRVAGAPESELGMAKSKSLYKSDNRCRNRGLFKQTDLLPIVFLNKMTQALVTLTD
jgi:hypothetical protein